MPSKIDRLKIKAKYQLYKNRFPFKPVFLIGCGRSGTTILGHSIGNHPQIVYLNERLDIWNKAYPEFDIWSGKINHPILIATRANHQQEKTQILRHAFHVEQAVSQSALVLEKTPINNFRLPFLKAAFPEARFIYLHRNGLEVARSIERLSSKGGWYGKNGQSKWTVLKNLIEANTNFKADELSFFEKALLEWRFSMEYSERFFKQLDPSHYVALSYASFIADPGNQLKHIFCFLGLEANDEAIKKAAERISRKSAVIQKPTAAELKLGGPLLQLSTANALRHTNPNPT